jgi:Mrp family chromosome partitioning ATPase/capsular polysaccharide biosynthesis protein
LKNKNLLDKKNPSASIIALEDRMSVLKDAGSGITKITLRGDRPDELTALANEIAHVYIAEILPKSEAASEDISKKEEVQIKEYRNNLIRQLEEARRRLDDCERRLREFNTKDEKVNALSTALKNRLSALEAERARLLNIYTPLYPGVISVESEIASVNEEIKALPPRPTGGFELEREFKDSEKIYSTLNKKWQEIRFKKVEDLVSAKRLPSIVSYATQIQPVFDITKKISFLLSWALIAIASGLACMLLATLLDSSILNQEDLTNYTHLAVTATLPYIKHIASDGRKKSETNLILKYEDQNNLVEPYRLLYTRMSSDLFDGQPKGKTVLMTSSVPHEGKSLIAANLSLVMARSGKKVILVDCNIARPSIHKIFGTGKNAAGLTDILIKGATLSSVVMNVTDMLLGGGMSMDQILKYKGLDRLNIISSGPSISAGGEVLRSSKLDTLLEELKANYDYIVLDAPSVSVSADSLILAPKSSAVYIVYSTGGVPRGHLRSAIRQLSAIQVEGANKALAVKGVIMNRCI